MEIKNQIFTRKRKPDNFPLNDLYQDLLEKVLSCLPTSSFFRLTSVSKKWKSVTNSATFTRACSDVPRRQPWFLMVPSQPHKTPQTTIIFDSSENNWKLIKNKSFQNLIPVAASGGLICFRNSSAGDLTVANPVTASSRQIPAAAAAAQQQHPTLAVAMASKPEGFKLVLVSGELPNLAFREYISGADEWGERVDLRRKSGDGGGESDKSAHYFLSKCGNVVSTDIQRSPSKQFSSVFVTDKKGDEVLYFLSSSGTVVSCNLTGRVFFEYPRILPAFSEYSIDLVEVGGEVFVVLLSEFLESASVRVWRWDGTWRQVAAMPPNMSHKFYGKKVDINCAGAGDGNMFVCLSWEEEEEEMCGGGCCCCVMCNLGGNEWIELPECCVGGGGEVNEFVSAFAFEPRIEASVWGATN